MTRKLGFLMVVMAVSLSASAAVNPGTISGYVRNSSGTPQMGASVEILTQAASQAQVVFTDANGHYRIKGLLPGTYRVKVSAPSFLPTIREKVGLQSGANVVINLTLNTLFEAVQLARKTTTTTDDKDDWRWTLRSVANRPILRLADDGPFVMVSKAESDPAVLKAKVAFIAGTTGEAYSGADMTTQFSVEQSVFGSNLLSFTGDVGHALGTPAAITAKYQQKLPNGSAPEFTFRARRFVSPELVARHAALQALAVSVSNTTALSSKVELNYGTQAEAVQYYRTAIAYRPFGSLDVHLSDNTNIEYQYSTARPERQRFGSFASGPQSGQAFAQATFANDRPVLERASHNEISISHRSGKNSYQLAAYRDRVSNTALTGTGSGMAAYDDLASDPYSGTFLYNGGALSTSGMRAVYQRKLFGDSSATLDYAYGGVLTAPENLLDLKDVRSAIRNEKRHAVAAKFSGTIPKAKTKVLTSYEWTSGDALTAVDMFNTSAGQADSHLNVFIRQPIPARHFIPAGMEALVDVRNLLAQGYRPVLSKDGSSLFLVQVPRSLRGGVSFTF